MAIVFRSGLDWSGDPGDPAKAGSSRDLAIAIVHVQESDLDRLERSLASVRLERGLPPDYPFKFKNAREAIRAPFFRAMRDCPVTVHLLHIDKRQWPRSFLTSTRGADRINHSIVELIRRCAAEFVGGQVLLIDGKKDETPTLEMARKALRQAMSEQRRDSFRKVRMIADDREAVIQVADMFAGLIRSEGVATARLIGPEGKVNLV
jgi:hypothetical protein